MGVLRRLGARVLRWAVGRAFGLHIGLTSALAKLGTPMSWRRLWKTIGSALKESERWPPLSMRSAPRQPSAWRLFAGASSIAAPPPTRLAARSLPALAQGQRIGEMNSFIKYTLCMASPEFVTSQHGRSAASPRLRMQRARGTGEEIPRLWALLPARLLGTPLLRGHGLTSGVRRLAV